MFTYAICLYHYVVKGAYVKTINVFIKNVKTKCDSINNLLSDMSIERILFILLTIFCANIWFSRA